MKGRQENVIKTNISLGCFLPGRIDFAPLFKELLEEISRSSTITEITYHIIFHLKLITYNNHELINTLDKINEEPRTQHGSWRAHRFLTNVLLVN